MEVQTERIKAYYTLMGLELTKLLIETDVSGKIPIADRPQGSRIAGLVAGGASHVIALKLDRLFRNAADALIQCDEWQRDGVALHLVDMGGTAVNTSSAMGKMMLTMLAGFAEFERATIGERITAALRHKKASNRVWNHTPYGKTRTPDGTLVDATDERAVITEVQGMRSTGMTFQAIADRLNANGTASTWRKPVGVEPTRDTKYRTAGLKPAPSTGQDWLPAPIVAKGQP